MNIRRPLLISFILLVFSTAALSGNIYRWFDDKGVAHYGDKPDIGAETELVRNGKPVVKSEPRTDNKETDEAKLAEIKKNQCDKARKRFNQFSSSDRIVETDEFGKKKELSAEERLTTIAKAKGDVESYCEDEG